MMSSGSRLPKANGLLPQHPESWSNTRALPPQIPAATFAQILVIMASSAPCTSVLPVERQPQVTQHIIVWQPNVVSVLGGDILMTSATFKSVGDVMPWDMWSLTVQSTHLPKQMFAALMGEHILTMMTSTPLWTTTEGMGPIEPEA